MQKTGKQISMKTTRVLWLALVLLMLSAGSYASASFPKNAKAKPVAELFATPYTNVVIGAGSQPFQFAVLPTPFMFAEEHSYYVPVTIGKVVNKPLVNYKYKGYQHYYHCNGSFDC